MVAKFLKLLENYFFFVFSDSLFLAINKSVFGFSVRLLGLYDYILRKIYAVVALIYEISGRCHQLVTASSARVNSLNGTISLYLLSEWAQ